MSDPKNNPGYVDPNYLKKLVELTAPIKKRSYELMRLAAGQHALDLGCGSGMDTIPMAQIVGATGKVTGVDYDEEMIATADINAAKAGAAEIITHKQGDALSLEIADNTFDAARSERVFQHLKDPEKALAEMIRVTKPGGWVVVVDTDHSSASGYSSNIDLEWKMRKFRTDIYNNGFSGRNLYRQFKQAGLENIQIEAYPLMIYDYAIARFTTSLDVAGAQMVEAGLVTEEELKMVDDHSIELDKQGLYFGYGIMFGAVGQKAG